MVAVVTDEQPAQKRRIGVGQSRGDVGDHRVNPRHHAVHRCRSHLEGHDVPWHDLTGDVVGNVPPAQRLQGTPLTDDTYVIARASRNDGSPDTGSHDEPVPPRVVGDDEDHPTANGPRIVDDAHDVVDRSGRHVVESRPLHRTVHDDDGSDGPDEKDAAQPRAMPTMATVNSARSTAKNRATSARSAATSDDPIAIPGLDASRETVRRRGPVYTVAAAGAIGLLGALLLVAPGALLGALGFVLIVIAAPLLGVTGAPLDSSLTAISVGIVGSAALWFGIGWWAARRACSGAVVGWREFIRELVPLAIGVVVGAGGALLVAALSLGVL
jgi:hypothetical protein